MQEDISLKQAVITESKYIDLIWTYFKYLKELKGLILSLPKIRKIK